MSTDDRRLQEVSKFVTGLFPAVLGFSDLFTVLLVLKFFTISYCQSLLLPKVLNAVSVHAELFDPFHSFIHF